MNKMPTIDEIFRQMPYELWCVYAPKRQVGKKKLLGLIPRRSHDGTEKPQAAGNP